MVFVNFGGMKIDNIAYAVAAIVLLPINSVLNPILYSSFSESLWKRLKSRVRHVQLHDCLWLCFRINLFIINIHVRNTALCQKVQIGVEHVTLIDNVN